MDRDRQNVNRKKGDISLKLEEGIRMMGNPAES